MLVNYSGIFIFGLLVRIVLALSASYNPNILLGIASNDAIGFVELAKQLAYNFTFAELKNQLELRVLYNVILGIIFKIIYPSQVVGNLFSVLIWAHSFYLIYSILNYLKLSKNSVFYGLLYFSVSPCIIVFTSITLRDCIILYFLINFLFFLLRFNDQKKIVDFIIFSFFLFLIYYTHYNFFYLFFIFTVLFTLTIFIFIHIRINFNILILSLLTILLLINLFDLEWLFQSINNFQQGSLHYTTVGRANYLENFFKIENLFSSIFYVIRNYFYFLFEPSFLNLGKVKIYDFVVIIEKLIKILLMVIFIFYILNYKKNISFSHLILVIILAIDTSWSIGTYNWGTAYRHQVTSIGFLPFIIAIIYEKKNLTNLQNE